MDSTCVGEENNSEYPSGAACWMFLTADRTVGPGAILDQHGHAVIDLQPLRDHACQGVGAATRRERDDNADWPVGIALRGGGSS